MSGYLHAQLASAFTTAVTHEDAATRARADRRVERWLRVLAGIASGTVTVGSRTPVAGLPAWATPEVVRGGFATGRALAEGPLRPQEAAVADSRAAAFAHHLTEAGQAELGALLDGGGYRLDQPEQAALLAVAWLLRAGDRARALALLETIGPYAERLCFVPVPDPRRRQDPQEVWRETAGAVLARLSARDENPRVEAQREALAVWNPFADELLTLWLRTGDDDGTVAARFPDGWHDAARALLGRYRVLAATYTRCGKHRRPKENAAILRIAAEQAVGAGLTARQRGLLRHAVASMLARRGRPGSAGHAALRAGQDRQASRPSHHRLARVVAGRVSGLDPDAGIRDVDAVCAPAGPDDPVPAVPPAPAGAFDPAGASDPADTPIPAGTPIPAPIRRIVRRAMAGPVDRLLDAGVLPSAEVLATLVPQLTAEAHAAAYPDPALRTLVAATHRAFAARRSLLLVDLQHQVRVDELPWMRELLPHRRADGAVPGVDRRLGELALAGFPATLLPNPLVGQLAALSPHLPWVEELAADIFMGRFSAKFPRAAALADELLAGTLYARYYDIERPARRDDFGARCARRAGTGRSGWSVAANGMVIEQAQILTTHNLATLVAGAGVVPRGGWAPAARTTFTTILRLAGRLDGNPRPLPVVKDIAYAWRQLIFHLTMDGADTYPVTEGFRRELAGARPAVRARIGPALTGLEHVAGGGRFTGGCSPDGGRRLLGWTTGRHWMP